MTVRQSAPPSPPPAFDPNRIPQGYEEAQRQQSELESDHARMRPHEAPTVMGPRQQTIPPIGTNGLAFTPAYVRQDYPAFRYHRTKAPDGVIVHSESEELSVCAGDGWQNTPVTKDTGVTTEQRLVLLDKFLSLLAPLAEDGEGPEDVLDRIIGERDRFARELAKKEKGNGPRK